MVDSVHSTAAEGAVTRTDKFGNSMPIIRPIHYSGLASHHPPLPQGSGSGDAYAIEHEGNHKGILFQHEGKWWARRDYPDEFKGPHESKHHAVSSLFE